MRLLRNKGFVAANVTNFLVGVMSFGVASLVPLYAEERYRLPALSAGTLLTARAIGTFAIGFVAAFALRRTGYRLPIIAGFFGLAAGQLAMSIAPRWGLTPYIWLSFGAAITGLGTGAVGPATRNASLQLAPDQVATITGLRSMFANLGVILSVAITTAILNRSANPALTQAHVLWVNAALIFLITVPLAYRVPQHKGAW
jgi:MFS family permease